MPPQAPEHKLTIIFTDIIVAVVLLIIGLALIGGYLEQILAWYQGILDWFYSHDWDYILTALTVIFVILDIGLIWFATYSIRSHRRTEKALELALKEKPVHIVTPKEEVRRSWEQIQQLINSDNPSNWNMAVLRADALLDEVLQKLGYEGLTIADRLKIVDPTQMPSLERVWSAHRLRNTIAHDPLEQHTKETTGYGVQSYEQAFRELGLIGLSEKVGIKEKSQEEKKEEEDEDDSD